MIFGQDRNQLRRMYIDAWRKHQAGPMSTGEGLTDLEQQIASVIQIHPEYHAVVADEQAALANDYTPEGGQSNPFLHMGMHLAIREQLGTNRPAGLRDAYQMLMTKLQDDHEVEHHIMECLGQALWEAQRAGREPDEQAYLQCVKRL